MTHTPEALRALHVEKLRDVRTICPWTPPVLEALDASIAALTEDAPDAKP